MEDKLLENRQLTDEELAVEAQAGSRRSFEELVRRYSQRLFYFLRPKMLTHQDTEDIIQETFLKTYRNIRRFNFECKFSTWIYTTATRLVISFYRKKRPNESTFVSIDTSPDPQEQMIKEEDAKNLWNIAQALRENQFQALWLRYMEDLPLKEIAQVMKKTQIYVRVLLHRARLNLMKQLNPSALPGKLEKAAPAETNLSLL
ncbi:MAG: sigma-70 family RNA polymerase sigma factor [Candidatus Aminicenantes bacterium]|nr:sigma-70 family RNA polymerase sigma factor [Candidatus Aminicenantes bacterium]NIM78322.1 sigma-70 family RNA polymerase sigma factor [Candidatus Aminicenantes bacterium]NIN17553.1 sigma-70 family RNA polymerase sigma factor [Candidatus Aminicenantes bacterium]NIN41439.1 sigma-70 family RNA polymerase sigma factor [Candidatus Aminicenantes bacterium]NIN84205.1 sigma-70 family RNA polymerase sigma factor [Candidatus Aminicenantes bacterium]